MILRRPQRKIVGVGLLDDESHDGHLVVEGLDVVTGGGGYGDQVLLLFSTSK